MTRTIPHRELRNNSSAILREVQGGEVIEITNHGVVVAVLIPPHHHQPYESMLVRKAKIKGGFSVPTGVRLDHPVQEDLDYLRGDH